MTEPTPLLRLPRREVPLWLPTSQRQLERPRCFRVGGWMLYEDIDRTISVADQDAVDWLATWDPPIRSRMLSDDPLPRPFDRLAQRAGDGSPERLTYAGLVAAVEEAVGFWTGFYERTGIVKPERPDPTPGAGSKAR